VVAVPVGYGADIVPVDVEDLVRLGAKVGARERTQVHDRDHAVRVVAARGEREDVDEFVDASLDPDLLGELAHGGHCRMLTRFDPTRDETPLLVVGPADEEDAAVVVEHGGIGPDLARDVAQLGEELVSQWAGFDRGTLRVLARSQLEQPFVPVAVERILRVVQSGTRNGANFVEQGEDVDRATLPRRYSCITSATTYTMAT